MIDKQINTCEFFNICEAACDGTLEDTEMCNCYELYKQLKRKEQECEELKICIESNEQQAKEVETLVMDNNRLINEIDQLNADNETYKNKAEKFEQTLIEIKDFVENEMIPNSDIHVILQKISEVEDEN